MSLPNLPLVNGNRYSFASMTVSLLGLRYFGIKTANYSGSLDPGKIRGTAPQVLGRTKGTYDAEGSIEMYEEEFDNFAPLLVQSAQQLGFQSTVGIMEIPFDVSVSYAEDLAPTITDILGGARIKKISKSRSEGNEGLSVSLDLDILFIQYGTQSGDTIFDVTPIDPAG